LGKTVDEVSRAKYKNALLHELCAMNHKRGWTQQFHIGVLRNTRSRLFTALGPDAGGDCMGDCASGKALALFLDTLDKKNRLAKTILFNSNPCDNELFACLAGGFQDGSAPGKMQSGPAWWFMDFKDGIVRHLQAISGMGLLGGFVGMTTDSRSLLSFVRHEYFRRILCSVIGDDMESGALPGDFNLVGRTIKDICYTNAFNYFGYTQKQ
jgi:glucuronate isomerase